MIIATQVTKLVNELNIYAPLLRVIHNDNEHSQAIELMEELIEQYDVNLIAIDALTNAISRYESEELSFSKFNKRIENADPAVATLKVLMNQHSLKTSDFENEIGKKSMVSQVLNGKKRLSRDHIERLAARFDISVALFLSNESANLIK